MIQLSIEEIDDCKFINKRYISACVFVTFVVIIMDLLIYFSYRDACVFYGISLIVVLCVDIVYLKRALYVSRAIKERNVFIAVLPCTRHKDKTSKHPPKATVLLDDKYIDVEMFDVNPLVINKMLNVIVFRVKDKVYCFAHHSIHDKLSKSIYNKAIMIREELSNEAIK